MTDQTPNLNAALAAFQAELPRVTKGELANITRKDGTSGPKYKYADLADVAKVAMPILAKHGLAFTAMPAVQDGVFGLRCILRHASGEEDRGFYLLPSPATTAPQQVGSAITYARRYALCAATGIAPDGDDDDASAQQGHESFDDAQPTRGSSWRPPANPHSRKADRSRGPMADDPWATDAPAEDAPGTSTPQQHRDIAIRLGNRGLKTREKKIKFCQEVTDEDRLARELPPVESSKDLSYAEAVKVLKLTEGANA
jgi:hypothetical protein